MNFLPEHIHLDILQYLPFKDLLRVSLVSKYWYSIIGNSAECMKKMRLRYDLSIESPDVLAVAKSSSRKFQSVDILYRGPLPQDYFERIKGLRRLLHRCADSMECIRSQKDLPGITSLPKLKEFSVSGKYFYFHPSGFLSKVGRVEKLTINSEIHNNAGQLLQSVIMKMKNLTHLTLTRNIFDTDEFERFECKLVQFTYDAPESKIIPGHENLMHFLYSQGTTLQKVVFTSHIPPYYLQFFMAYFPYLRTLHYYFCRIPEELELPDNYTIRELKIFKLYTFASPLLPHLKKLTLLRCQFLGRQELDEIEEYMFQCRNSWLIVLYGFIDDDTSEIIEQILLDYKFIRFEREKDFLKFISE